MKQRARSGEYTGNFDVPASVEWHNVRMEDLALPKAYADVEQLQRAVRKFAYDASGAGDR